jgi:hypothetical protein
MVGERFQTSLLTAEQSVQLKNAKPGELKKALLNALKTFVDDCGRFYLKACVSEGNELLQDIASAEDADIASYVPAAESFASHYEEPVALQACVFDLGKVLAENKNVHRAFKEFSDRYGEFIESSVLAAASSSFGEAQAKLKALVDFCEKSL